MKKKIYWVGELLTKNTYTEPYWERYMAISHIEEIKFPKTWQQLYRQGYRIKSKEIEI